jgi:cobalt-zinc-cadmium efflux system membrane fusion protein
MKAIYIISLLTAAALSACSLKPQEEEIQKESIADLAVTLSSAQLKHIHLSTTKIEKKKLGASIEVNGMLDVPPQNLITVSALLGGFIKTTSMLQGIHVKKGEVIAQIQNPEFITIQQNYLENKSRLGYLEQEYKRQEELSKENVAAAKTFQQATADYHSAVATNGALKEKLKMIGINPDGLNQNNIKSIVNIYSPINGYVTVVNINIGSYLNPQDIICEIVDTDHLHAELTVFEKDITKVKVGQKVVFKIVNGNDADRFAHVYLINHKISADRTVRVHAHLDKDDPTLIPNMYLKAFIQVDEYETLAVPSKALVEFDGASYLFVESVSNGEAHTYKAVEVKKGISEGNFTAIEFLSEGDTFKDKNVVVDGSYDLLAKMRNVEEEE